MSAAVSKTDGNRKGGRPKGIPRTGGRQKGTPNKITADVRALASQYSDAAIQELARLSTKAESETARVSAIKELLDRAYGKPSQAVEHSGPNGSAIKHIVELSDEALTAIATGRG